MSSRTLRELYCHCGSSLMRRPRGWLSLPCVGMCVCTCVCSVLLHGHIRTYVHIYVVLCNACTQEHTNRYAHTCTNSYVHRHVSTLCFLLLMYVHVHKYICHLWIHTVHTYICTVYYLHYTILCYVLHSTSRNPQYNDLLAVGHGICECGSSIMHHISSVFLSTFVCRVHTCVAENITCTCMHMYSTYSKQ